MGFQLIDTTNGDIKELLEFKKTINQEFNFGGEAAIIYNMSPLKQIPREITNVGIFHTLQITGEIYIYEPCSQSSDVKITGSLLKEGTKFKENSTFSMDIKTMFRNIIYENM